MEFLATVAIIELLAAAGVAAENQYRREMIRRWRAGSLTEVELRWLKRQRWFMIHFKKVSCPAEKKSN